jgi:hypothetical protein
MCSRVILCAVNVLRSICCALLTFELTKSALLCDCCCSSRRSAAETRSSRSIRALNDVSWDIRCVCVCPKRPSSACILFERMSVVSPPPCSGGSAAAAAAILLKTRFWGSCRGSSGDDVALYRCRGPRDGLWPALFSSTSAVILDVTADILNIFVDELSLGVVCPSTSGIVEYTGGSIRGKSLKIV